MEEEINKLIQQSSVDKNKISDGYHTFGELYDHRIALFIALCRIMQLEWKASWKSKLHSDGSSWNGWFILGIYTKPGHQITYHLPEHYWTQLDDIPTIDRAPEYDGHTPEDVIRRLLYRQHGAKNTEGGTE